MTILAFVRPNPIPMADPPTIPANSSLNRPETKLRRYGRALRLCFIAILTTWVIVQLGCVSSLFLHFRHGIVAGTIDGTIAFKFWPALNAISPGRGAASGFVPHIFPPATAIGYSLILLIASVPFCAALLTLAQLFDLYAQGEIFTQRTAAATRRIAHAVLATGVSPLLLGPFAHAIGVLKPVTGVTTAMIAFVVLGLVLLAISHVMAIGQRLQQDQEAIL